MRSYSYYPGCSCSEGTAKAYNKSILAVSRVLGLELQEIEDWNCCGSSPYSAFNELGMLSLAARNLALAEKRGLDLVTPCSACYVILNQANNILKQYPETRASVDTALAAGGLKYENTVRVRHILDVIVNDVGYDAVALEVKRDLGGLKTAPYYGCQIVRPGFGFDHTENPAALDKLITGIKAEVIDFPLKTTCCGSSLVLSEEKIALGLIKKILDAAAAGGAQCIITVCPLCQMNVDAYQSTVNRKFGTNYAIPVLFFTQLMGLAFGLNETELGLEGCIVPVDRVLAKYV